MSLTDALLLDPLGPPRMDVWIALRPDGAKGSGTEDDPYDGSTRESTRLTISALTSSFNPSNGVTTATASVSGHGYANDDLVRITGASGDDGEWYNGLFRIYGAQANSFQYSMNGTPSGAAAGPLQCSRVLEFRLDTVLNSVPEYRCVRIGPGVFETRGYGDGDPSWQPKSGQKIRGSGIDITVLKLVATKVQNTPYFAFGMVYNGVGDYLEISDLTVDCNLDGQTPPENAAYPAVACGAIRLNGNHMRVSRVKTKNFGTRTMFIECFAVALYHVHPHVPGAVTGIDNIIEDCIAVEPSQQCARETSVFHIGGATNPTSYVPYFTHACRIRRCVVDGAFRDGAPQYTIYGLGSWSGGVVTVNVENGRGHWLQVGDYVRITAPGAWNGYFKVTSVGASSFQYAQATDPTGGPVWLRAGGVFQALSMGGCLAGVVEENTVSNVGTGGPYADTGSIRDLIIRRNTYRNVKTGPFIYMGGTTLPPLPIIDYVKSGSNIIATSSQVPYLLPGDVIKVSGAHNPLNDGENLQVVAVQGNTFTYVNAGGVSDNVDGGNAERFDASLFSLSRITAKLARGTTQIPAHGLIVGDRVLIANADIPEYNGFFEIKAVTIDTFDYETLADPPSSPANNSTFQRVWGVDRVVIEDNSIELNDRRSGEAEGDQYGITVADSVGGSPLIPAPPPYVNGQAVIRNNRIRHMEGQIPGEPYYSVGVSLNSMKAAIIERNVIDVVSTISTPAYKVEYMRSGSVKCFENKTSAGQLIRGYDHTRQVYCNEIQDTLELAFLLSA